MFFRQGERMELSKQCKLLLLTLSLVFSYVYTQCPRDDIDVESLVTRYVGLDGASLWTGNTGDILACARACVRMKICESFNFYDLSGHCDLFHTARSATSLTKEDVYILSSNINKWPLAKLDQECSSRPCGVNEVCMPGRLSVNANPTTGCSYTCIKMRIVCPMPPVLSGGREVNDVNVFTCGRAYVGGDNATCLPNRQWSKEIDTTCKPLINHPCQDSNFCAPINADCVGGTCVCRQFMTYSTTTDKCEKACPNPPQLAWANLTLDGTLGTYTCNFTGTSPTPSSNNTIECTRQGTWQPERAFSCFGVRFSRILDDNSGPSKSPLANGSNSGLVELFYNQSGWVTLKDRGKWMYQLTKLFCKTLNPNYVYGGTYYKDGNPYRSDLVQAAEIEFDCTGTELSLADCVKARHTLDNKHDKDYAIVCYESDVNNTKLRLVDGKDNNTMWGRLEVLYGGSWYLVCTDNWDDNDAEAACRTINPRWKRESKSCSASDCPIPSPPPHPFIMNGLQCEDDRVPFMFCPMSADFSSCDSSKVATLKCKL